MAGGIEPAERVLNLIIALINTKRRMTRSDVRARVAGYDEPATDAAFERMFERDKVLLREMGVPLTVVGQDGPPDEVGYLITPGEWGLAEVEFTAAEMGVLNLAAQVWRDQAIGADAALGAAKLAGAGADADVLVGLEPRLSQASSQYFRPLLDAITACQEVEITYRAASSGERSRRRIQPWRLYARGGWYLLAWDTKRAAARTFRLSRIEGQLKVLPTVGAFAPPTAEQIDAERSGPAQTARVAVLPGRGNALRARAVATESGFVAGAQRDIVDVTFTDPVELAAELVAYGDAALVLEPAKVRDRVVDLLTAAAGLATDA